MPYPSEHAARIASPDKFKKFRREDGKFGSGIDVIWGITTDDNTEIQAIRFDASKFTPEKARAWLKEHKMSPILFEKAIEASLVFRCKGTPALALSDKGLDDGKPYQLYQKGAIKVGDYVKTSDNLEFQVTRQTLEHWNNVIHAMLSNGVQIPVPADHPPKDPYHVPAEMNRGWVVDSYVDDSAPDGAELVLTLKMIGEDGIALAHRSDVSIYSPVDYTDGKGNNYIRPIMHVALCTDPVIPGLSGWKAIAASLAGVGDLVLDKVRGGSPNLGKDGDMDPSKLKEVLGIKEEMTEENSEALVLSAATALRKRADEADKKQKELSDALEAEKKAHGDLKLSHQPRKADPLVVKLMREARRTKLMALVASAKVTKAVKDELEDMFIGKDSQALTLSLESCSGDDPGGFDKLCAILAKNDPVKLKELSGCQTLSLADPNKEEDEDEKNPLIKDAEARAEAAKKKEEQQGK